MTPDGISGLRSYYQGVGCINQILTPSNYEKPTKLSAHFRL
jgi:hypothetical protein